eukprot:GFUD01004453.1.p1 GENE.GFUD01004453.1~~GFUD01004453.1.p1  ORF type:complete len:480 (-),score=121.93 GFUD01004453.1:122-1561(-)
MASLLAAASGARKLLLGEGEPSIDNWTFRLFYQWTTSILLASSVMVTSNQFFGDPIQCDLPGGGVSEATLKTYCWMYSTFNIPDAFQGNCARKRQSDDEMYNTYYQWVSLCLVGQACLFYLPRALWLSLEGGLMKHLAKDKTAKIIEDAEQKCDCLLTTFNLQLRNKYDRYFYGFLGCEVLNIVIVISQLFLTNRFLGGNFLTYGSDVYQYYSLPAEETTLENIHNPMCEAFPRVASCTYYQYGAGGGQNALNALCILSLNIIIDKVYLIIWFWYVFLIVFGLVRLIQRMFQVSPIFRYRLMKLRMHRYFKKSENIENIKCYLGDCSIGDWFVLYQMSKNMNRRLFFMFLTNLAKVPRSQILQLLPQIRVVKAFQSSVKNEKKIASKEEKNDVDYFSKKKDESPEKKQEDDKENDTCGKKRHDSDSDEKEVCYKFPKKKEVYEEKVKDTKAVGTQMSPYNEAKNRAAYEQSFGQRKYRK